MDVLFELELASLDWYGTPLSGFDRVDGDRSPLQLIFAIATGMADALALDWLTLVSWR